MNKKMYKQDEKAIKKAHKRWTSADGPGGPY